MRYIGEASAIGPMDPEDQRTMLRLKIIDIETLDELAGGANTTRELIAFTRRGIEKGGIAYGVYGSPAKKDLHKDEWGELQGWVIFYRDEPKRVKRLIKQGILTVEDDRFPVIELAISKLENALHGQMASALRQALANFSGKSAHFSGDLENKRLSPNKPHFLITAYVAADEPAEVHLHEAAGFVRRGTIEKYEEFNKMHYVYVLDWKRHSQIMKEKAATEGRKAFRDNRIYYSSARFNRGDKLNPKPNKV